MIPVNCVYCYCSNIPSIPMTSDGYKPDCNIRKYICRKCHDQCSVIYTFWKELSTIEIINYAHDTDHEEYFAITILSNQPSKIQIHSNQIRSEYMTRSIFKVAIEPKNAILIYNQVKNLRPYL